MHPRHRVGGLLVALLLTFVLASCDLLSGIVPTPTPAPAIGTPDPNSISYDLLAGETDGTQSFSFTNTGDADLDYTVTVSSGDGWLTITSGASGTVADGASQTVDLSATCASTDDDSATVTISDDDSAAMKSVAVDLTCSGTTSNVFLAAAVGDAGASDTFSFLNSDAAGQDFSISGVPPWLTVTPMSGTVAAAASQDIVLDADACGANGAEEANLDITFSDATTIKTAVLAPLTVNVFQVCSSAPGDYDIQLLFFGDGFTKATLDPFLTAEARWESVITGDLEDISGFTWDANDCGFDEPSFGTLDIKAVAIAVKVGEIDGTGGPSNTLARAGPCRLRVSGPDAPLTSTGVMEFDEADIGSFADLETVVLHEMGHVLGIGTLWDNLGLLDFEPLGGGTTFECLSAGRTTDPTFTGALALAQYDTLLGGGSGASGVPVANEGGGGTECGHWDEQNFDEELMTGIVENPGPNPMSAMTIDSLADLGYTVDIAQADAYAIPACAPACTPPALQASSVTDLGAGEVLLRPIGGVTADGQKVPLPE